MELIVKLGADQQGLKDTIERIHKEFKSSNVSIPASWAPSVSAAQNYGGIMRSAPAGGGGFAQFKSELTELSPILGGFASKIGSLAGPIGLVSAAIGAASYVFKTAADKLNEAKDIARESRISGLSGSMVKHLRYAGERSTIGAEEARDMVNKMNVSAGEFIAGNPEAMKLWAELGINPSGMTGDEVLMALKKRFTGIEDPATRARLSKAVFGKGAYGAQEVLTRLEGPNMWENQNLADLANRSKAQNGPWNKFKHDLDVGVTEITALALGKSGGPSLDAQVIGELENQDVLRKRAEATVQAEAEYRKKAYQRLSPEMKLYQLQSAEIPAAQIAYNKQSGGNAEFWITKNRLEELGSEARLLQQEIDLKKKEKTPKDKTDTWDKQILFQADMLAQAGLFAGSSLLYNPAGNVQERQLAVLERIEGNQHLNPFSP